MVVRSETVRLQPRLAPPYVESKKKGTPGLAGVEHAVAVGVLSGVEDAVPVEVLPRVQDVVPVGVFGRIEDPVAVAVLGRVDDPVAVQVLGGDVLVTVSGPR
jgi:hypothetical protein